jgi:hypothetical protein
MSSVDTSYIQNKQNENNDDSDNNSNSSGSKNNITGFFVSLLTSAIFVIMFALVGSNYVYLTQIDLDKYFPSDLNNVPYVPGNIKTGGALLSTDECGKTINFMENSKLFNKDSMFTKMFSHGFPYSLDENAKGLAGFFNSLTLNLFKNQYGIQRSMMKSIITTSKYNCDIPFLPKNAKNLINFTFGWVFMILCNIVTYFSFIPGIFLWFANSTFFQKIFLFIGLFWFYTWMIPYSLSIFQCFSLFGSFILLPILFNFDEVFKIMKNKYNILVCYIIYITLVLMSAFTTLQTEFAIGILIAFLLSLGSLSTKMFMKPEN